VDVVNKGLFARVRLSEAKSNNNNKTLNAVKLFKKKFSQIFLYLFPDFLLSKHYVNIILFVNREKSAPPLFFVLYSKC